MNYLSADEYLSKARGHALHRKIGTGRATWLVRNSGVPGDSIHLKLFNTNIITWYADGRIELNTGGYKTVTTKERLNRYLEGYGIFQKNWEWYLLKKNPKFDGQSGEPYWIKLGLYAGDRISIFPDGRIHTGGLKK